MEKKGDISINVIIVAALALIVLVIVGAILTTRLGWFGAQVEKGCVANGGRCISDDFLTCEDSGLGKGFSETTKFNCPTGNKCCISDIIQGQR